MTLFDIRVTTTVNWLGAPRCLRQMKRCSEQEETTSIDSVRDTDEFKAIIKELSE